MGEPSPEEILSALRGAGWLLEQDTARALDRHGFYTNMGWAYQDPDEPSASRELDVTGYHQYFRSEDAAIYVSARVLAECKQSANPYVLIGRTIPQVIANQQPTEHVLRYRRLLKEKHTSRLGQSIELIHAWTHLGLHQVPGSPSLDTFRATQMTRLDRKDKHWTADNRGIFNALMFPLAKALRAAQQGVPTDDYSIRIPTGNRWSQVALFFPVVVTSAPLYVVDATEEESEPVQVSWTRLSRQLKTLSLEGTFNIDIVSYTGLDEYLTQRVNTFAQSVTELVRAKPHAFTSNEIVGGR